MRTRRPDLDRAKGLAIILVVFGHLVARQGPTDVTWYEPLRQAVYLFHMPFFFFLSGYAATLAPKLTWPRLARSRATRLLLPFAAFGLLILAGKLALGPYLLVDNLPPSLPEGLMALLWNTAASPATSVWYLFALFAFTLAAPPLTRLGGPPTLIATAALLYLLPAPPILYLDRIFSHFLFFVIGLQAGAHAPAWDRITDRAWPWALTALLLTVTLAAILPAPRPAWMLAAGLLAMPALHGAARAWASPAMLWLGRHVFAIYLLNTICIGLAKAALMPILPWHGANFPAFAATLMAAGLLGPVLISAIWARAADWSPAPPAKAGSPQ